MKDLDLLVLSGDLANEDAEPGAYRYFVDFIKSYPVPVCVIPGNHDRVEVMEKFFDLSGKVQNGKCYYRYDIKGKSIFFLDSACGDVSSEQLDWLNTTVTLQGHTTVTGNVYGGGDEGVVGENTSVFLEGNTQVDGNVFGAGNHGAVSGNSSVTIQDTPTP